MIIEGKWVNYNRIGEHKGIRVSFAHIFLQNLLLNMHKECKKTDHLEKKKNILN